MQSLSGVLLESLIRQKIDFKANLLIDKSIFAALLSDEYEQTLP